jgi:hypothetical protein
VGAETEAKGTFGKPFSVHVELVRLGEYFLVSVGRLVGRNNALAGFDGLFRRSCALVFVLSPPTGCPEAYLPANLDVNLGCPLNGQC